MPHAWFELARSKVTKFVALVPAETSFAVPVTETETPAARATSAHGCTVTVAEPPIEMLFGTWWVTPFPAQVSSALMLAEWVTTVPFGVPQATAACVTVTFAEPVLLGSSVLTAVMVYVPAVPEVNVALEPLGVSVPPEGDAFQATALEQVPVAVTVAVSVEVAPVATELGLAATPTAETAQGLPPFPPLPRRPRRGAPPRTAEDSSTRHPGARDARLDMGGSPELRGSPPIAAPAATSPLATAMCVSAQRPAPVSHRSRMISASAGG